MTFNMMNEPLSHIHFTIAILISLIIHITFVIYGNFNINSDGYNKIQSDIELIIIEKPEKESVIIESSSALNTIEIIEEEPKEEIIFKEEVIVKIPAQESIPTKKLLATEEDLAISENTIPATEEDLAISEINIPTTQEEAKIISTSELISNLGNLDLAPRKKLSTNRVKTISASTKDYEYRLYFEAWRQKVERIGALNYPESAKAGNLGALRLTVSLNKEGNIKEIIINKTSGNKELDEAAIKIVRLGEPYAVFSSKMQKEVDLINITRTWKFTEDSYSSN
ncbi:TonB family protein [Methylophilaceae bacterium]|nr:TonB family protein [Methylophilaceae bacterium]